ncbi:hypothetical protein [Streptomyces sp. CC208A]|uniref:hypothetical protein n=1 Tax=Streptomyces sp. CC208A TaxID=3044573 RepID=UPI0024A85FBE|nr:hypothetical protein [Streptomyces sp. CC208A]
MTQPRHTADSITDTALDALYAELDTLRAVARSNRDHVRAIVPDLEAAMQRADQVEDLLRVAHETSNRSEAERARAVQRAERAEAALNAVRALHAPVQYGKWTICGHCSGYGDGSCDNGAEPHPCATLRALDTHTTPTDT